MIFLWILAAVIMLALLGKVARAILGLLTGLLAAAGALLVTALFGAAFDLDASREAAAIVAIFVLSFVALLALCRQSGRRRAPMPAGVPIPTPGPGASVGSRAERNNDPADFASDLERLRKAARKPLWIGKFGRDVASSRRLGIAWEIVETCAPEHGARIAVSKRSCTRLLALTEEGPLGGGPTLDAITLVRKGIPELVEAYLAYVAKAPAHERKEATAEMISSIERVAARAERENEATIRGTTSDFSFQRDHLDRRSREDQI